MTPDQINLARHALGLPSKAGRSWRRHFCSTPGGRDHADWMAMVEGGFAIRHPAPTVPFGGDDLFRITRSGAELALHPGESLDTEDFPEAPA